MNEETDHPTVRRSSDYTLMARLKRFFGNDITMKISPGAPIPVAYGDGLPKIVNLKYVDWNNRSKAGPIVR